MAAQVGLYTLCSYFSLPCYCSMLKASDHYAGDRKRNQYALLCLQKEDSVIFPLTLFILKRERRLIVILHCTGLTNHELCLLQVVIKQLAQVQQKRVESLSKTFLYAEAQFGSFLSLEITGQYDITLGLLKARNQPVFVTVIPTSFSILLPLFYAQNNAHTMCKTLRIGLSWLYIPT